MGLDESFSKFQGNLEKAALTTAFESRIDYEAGFRLALEHEKQPTVIADFYSKPKNISENFCLLHFKRISRLVRRAQAALKNKGSLEDLTKLYLGNKMHEGRYTSEDLEELYIPLLELVAEHPAVLEKISSHPVVKAGALQGKELKRWMKSFEKRTDAELYSQAQDFMLSLKNTINEFDNSGLANKLYKNLLLSAASLFLGLGLENRLLRSGGSDASVNYYESTIKDLVCRIMPVEEGAKRKSGLQSNSPKHTLHARLNNSPRSAMINLVDCCITGPFGKYRDASALYWLDNAVHLLEFYIDPSENDDNFPFGIAIFFEAEGRHHTKSNDNKYLVLEGFITNQNEHRGIQEIRQEFVNFFGETRQLSLPSKWMSIPQAVYYSGLYIAHMLGKEKLFINTQHGPNSQRSVEATVLSAAQKSKLPSELWNFKRGKFELLGDCSGKFSYIADKKGNLFEYTHHLRKEHQFDSELVKRLRRKPEWNGEILSDALHDWNKYIMETHSDWPESLQNEHPYARAVYERGTSPSWNLGIGYCKGFEVDVKSECEKNKITLSRRGLFGKLFGGTKSK
jgi:hypothetical protein